MRALARMMIKVLSGAVCFWLLFDMHFGDTRKQNPARSRAPRWLAPLMTAGFNLALLGLCIYSGRWYLYFLLWVYPLVAITVAQNEAILAKLEERPSKLSPEDQAIMNEIFDKATATAAKVDAALPKPET